MAAAAALFGVLAAAVGCGSDTPSAQSSGSQTSPTSDDVIRIHYAASGKMAGWPWSFEQELIADSKPLRTRLTQTAQGAEDGGWPVGYYLVWDGEYLLKYCPECEPHYTRTAAADLEESPARELRPEPDEIRVLCTGAAPVGTEVIAGRPTVHYQCREGAGELEIRGLWLDEADGWLMKETFYGGTASVTATEFEIAPDTDDDTFSTSVP